MLTTRRHVFFQFSIFELFHRVCRSWDDKFFGVRQTQWCRDLCQDSYIKRTARGANITNEIIEESERSLNGGKQNEMMRITLPRRQSPAIADERHPHMCLYTSANSQHRTGYLGGPTDAPRYMSTVTGDTQLPFNLAFYNGPVIVPTTGFDDADDCIKNN